ncbi:hypothetical protein HF313_24650 [Massilia atriviolacea]|uniref:Uncharacterized protein n=1 Tax=Massilia atriviolacea TaxID=2495579 RepID=A0A430HJX9_9BURK|nr:hypothetical protein [Massilia atriviolacea]RSZ57801.1 hypothetical protein EJB06_15835 [Massilia atriviolacea]
MSTFAKCDLTFVCRERWDDLAITDSTDVRYCPNCDNGVFKVRTRAQFELASQLGRCAALTNDNDIVGWIGESDFDWMAEQSETVAIRTHLPLDASTESRLRIAFPKVIEIANGFPTGKWVVIGTFSPAVAANLDTDIRAQFPDLEVQERLG